MVTVIFLGLLFLMSIQPIMMVMMLIFITLMYSFLVYYMMGSYWFSYALVLVMLSGVLVVFTYMVSLVPNESFEIYSLLFIVFFMLVMIKGELIDFGGDYSYISLNLWVSYVGIFNLFLVGFLLSVMVMVIWISCMSEGAVRVMYLCAWLKG